jgi:hypothetical protein
MSEGATVTLKELIRAAQTTVLDQQKLIELKYRLEQADKQFESQVLTKAASNEFLSRTYSL